MKKIVIATIIIIIAVLGYVFRDTILSVVPIGMGETDLYAVHLSNGQVYFGYIDDINETTIVMGDAYYLELFKKANTNVSTSENFSLSTEGPSQDIYQITRRGSTGSVLTDHRFFINRSVVLFWEKLAPDAELVRLIGEAKKEE